jgi:hypothetical protein
MIRDLASIYEGMMLHIESNVAFWSSYRGVTRVNKSIFLAIVCDYTGSYNESNLR